MFRYPELYKVGMAVANAQTLYGNRGTLITSPSGSKSIMVRVTGTALALVLYLDPAGNTVTGIGGGSPALKFRRTHAKAGRGARGRAVQGGDGG